MNHETGLYESYSSCSGPRFRLTDCNSVIDAEMDQCKLSEISDYGVNYGGYIQDGQCVAVGDSSAIMAQAPCCRLD